MTSQTPDLVPVDEIGPMLVEATGDERWHSYDASLIAGGKSNLTYEVTSGGQSLIVRRQPTGAILPRAHDLGREVRIQRALAGTAVPVPRIVCAELTGELIGRTFYVMEKVPGLVIRHELPEAYLVAPDARARLTEALVGTLAALHQVDAASVGLSDFGRPDGFFDRQVRRWRQQWERSRTHAVPAVEELGRRLESRTPRPQRTSITHGDFRLDNCMMDADDPGAVRAVLDWELSTLGDPLADLGLLLMYWRGPEDPPSRLTPAVTTDGRFPSRDDLAERYATLTGLDVSDVDTYRALAHFKFAVIAQGIAARVAADAMGGQDFGDLDDEVVRNVEQGLAVLD